MHIHMHRHILVAACIFLHVYFAVCKSKKILWYFVLRRYAKSGKITENVTTIIETFKKKEKNKRKYKEI